MNSEITKCDCFGTGFVGQLICVNHLKEAFQAALRRKDKEMAAVILAKQKELTHG